MAIPDRGPDFVERLPQDTSAEAVRSLEAHARIFQEAAGIWADEMRKYGLPHRASALDTTTEKLVAELQRTILSRPSEATEQTHSAALITESAL